VRLESSTLVNFEKDLSDGLIGAPSDRVVIGARHAGHNEPFER
jgi:hypothetical protein